MSNNLQQRMDELIANGSVAAVWWASSIALSRVDLDLDVEENGEDARESSSMESGNDGSSRVDSLSPRFSRTISNESNDANERQWQHKCIVGHDHRSSASCRCSTSTRWSLGVVLRATRPKISFGVHSEKSSNTKHVSFIVSSSVWSPTDDFRYKYQNNYHQHHQSLIDENDENQPGEKLSHQVSETLEIYSWDSMKRSFSRAKIKMKPWSKIDRVVGTSVVFCWSSLPFHSDLVRLLLLLCLTSMSSKTPWLTRRKAKRNISLFKIDMLSSRWFASVESQRHSNAKHEWWICRKFCSIVIVVFAACLSSFSPHSQMPLSIAFLPTPQQRGMKFNSTITLRTPSDNGQEDLVLQRSLHGQFS